MGVKVVFSCGGCDAVADGTAFLRREFISFNGKGWGFGRYKDQKPVDVLPDRWMIYDIVGATYCPKCADELYPEGLDDE